MYIVIYEQIQIEQNNISERIYRNMHKQLNINIIEYTLRCMTRYHEKQLLRAISEMCHI